MSRMVWGVAADRSIEQGLDRGVLYPRNKPAAAWNGLISVDESAGEAATSYYIDGRPFLQFSKPKEFSATLRAYTYPDVFSEIMGLVEVADGMYLDSQTGDAFDLCYRTMIANAAVGDRAGHKLHLVYNATVVSPGRSYQTLSDAINPVDMSWEIQAVPVIVEGYRPTAHIVIDTRNIDPAKLQQIENLLYGTISTEPSMPTPQQVFDILSYGDTIIITDNGNGTWTALGSRDNIYMIGDGIFQIDNVNAVHHGDGTYTISSTP